MKPIIKLGLAGLATGAFFFGVSFPAKGDQLVWGRAQQLDFWRARGLVPPGSYSQNENRIPSTIAVNKAGQGVGQQKQTTSKASKKNVQHTHSTSRGS